MQYDNLDLFADLIEPVAAIIGDKAVTEPLQSGKAPVVAVKAAIKRHKAEVCEILARLDGVDPSNYEPPSPIVLAGKLLRFVNSADFKELFTSPQQTRDSNASDSVAGSTTETDN